MSKQKKPTVALIYDFDGTLSPGNMQEYGFIPSTGLSAEEFWRKSREMTESQDASEILCYMRLMIEEANHKRISLKRESFKKYGSCVDLFKGVNEWFDLINDYGKKKGLKIEHYINSSGLKEIIEGTPIAKYFKRIYACSFYYSGSDVAEWPAVAVDFTAKTQFLFMINKGIESVKDNKKVNDFKPDFERPIPFRHMIYFGDGATDIPCMKLVKQSGGYSIAVYTPKDKTKKKSAEKLIYEGRVNFVCPADYSRESQIHQIVKKILDKIYADFEVDKLVM